MNTSVPRSGKVSEKSSGTACGVVVSVLVVMAYATRTGRVGGLLNATEKVAVAPSASASGGAPSDTVIGSFALIVTLALVFGAIVSSTRAPAVAGSTRRTISSSPSFRSSSTIVNDTVAELAVRRIVTVPVESATS